MTMSIRTLTSFVRKFNLENCFEIFGNKPVEEYLLKMNHFQKIFLNISESAENAKNAIILFRLILIHFLRQHLTLRSFSISISVFISFSFEIEIARFSAKAEFVGSIKARKVLV